MEAKFGNPIDLSVLINNPPLEFVVNSAVQTFTLVMAAKKSTEIAVDVQSKIADGLKELRRKFRTRNINNKFFENISNEKRFFGTSWYRYKEEKAQWMNSKDIEKAFRDKKAKNRLAGGLEIYGREMPAPAAVFEIAATLDLLYGGPERNWDVQKKTAEACLEDHFTFLLGSSASNKFSNKLMEKKDVPTEFDLNSPNHELSLERGKTYSPEYDHQTESYKSDYGLIIKKSDFKLTPKGVLGLMGCHGFGTIAATKILTEPSFVKGGKEVTKTLTDAAGYDNFYMIIEVTIDEGELIGVKKEECFQL